MRITRTEWHDWYLDGDESAVFAGDKVTVLSELATTLVTLVGDGVELHRPRRWVDCGLWRTRGRRRRSDPAPRDGAGRERSALRGRGR